MNEEGAEVTLLVIQVLEELEIPYLIGGSLASTAHGAIRATLDADLVADVEIKHIPLLVSRLQPDFYISTNAVVDAIIHRTSFNLIHFASTFKVDIFVPKQRPFDHFQFANRTRQIVATNPDRTAFVASPEDTILSKLEWFRLGGEVSDRQWRDILGVIQVQGERLNLVYLRERANELAVSDLLEKALG